MNAGPARIAGHMVTLEYCRELGVPIEVFTNANADAYYYNEGVGPLSGKPIRHRTGKADVYGYVSELLAKATDQGALDARLTAADKERLIAFLRSFGAIGNAGHRLRLHGRFAPRLQRRPRRRDRGRHRAGPAVRARRRCSRAQIGQNFSFEFGWDQAMLMFQPVGGMDRIPYALAEAVRRTGGRIVYDAPVTRDRQHAAGVRVGYRDGWRTRVAEADFAVRHDPAAGAEGHPEQPRGRDARTRWPTPCRSPPGRSASSTAAASGRRTSRSTAASPTPTWTCRRSGTRRTATSATAGSSSATTTSAPTPCPTATRRWPERLSRAVAQGRKIHGDAVRRTSCAPRSRSPGRRSATARAAGCPGPRARAASTTRLLEPDGNVYFAGDHLSYYIAWQAGAIESARKVVMQTPRPSLERDDRCASSRWCLARVRCWCSRAAWSPPGRLAPGWDFSQVPAPPGLPADQVRPGDPQHRHLGARPVHRQRRQRRRRRRALLLERHRPGRAEHGARRAARPSATSTRRTSRAACSRPA